MNTLSNLFNMSLRLLYAAIGAYLTFLVNTLNWLQRTLANATGWLLARRQSYTAGTGFTGMVSDAEFVFFSTVLDCTLSAGCDG